MNQIAERRRIRRHCQRRGKIEAVSRQRIRAVVADHRGRSAAAVGSARRGGGGRGKRRLVGDPREDVIGGVEIPRASRRSGHLKGLARQISEVVDIRARREGECRAAVYNVRDRQRRDCRVVAVRADDIAGAGDCRRDDSRHAGQRHDAARAGKPGSALRVTERAPRRLRRIREQLEDVPGCCRTIV